MTVLLASEGRAHGDVNYPRYSAGSPINRSARIRYYGAM